MVDLEKYKVVKRKTEHYSDFSTNLLPHPDTKELVRSTNENAVRRSIRNLILTNEFERPFQPEIKSNVTKILFEHISIQNAEALKGYIRELIDNHEPRAKLLDVQVTPYEHQQSYTVNVIFFTINNPAPTNFEIKLDRIR